MLFLLFICQLGTDVGISNPAMKSLKTFMRIFAVVLIPLTAYFPAVSLTISYQYVVPCYAMRGMVA